jgi:hypothetical protein
LILRKRGIESRSPFSPSGEQLDPWSCGYEIVESEPPFRGKAYLPEKPITGTGSRSERFA